MKILITGGAGFQGSHLTENLLKKGHKITILNTHSKRASLNAEFLKSSAKERGLKIIWGSVLDRGLVDKTIKNNDLIFHLAAKVNVDESLKDPAMVTEVNVKGTVNVLDSATKHRKRLVFCSTCEVYGDGHDEKRLNEKSPLLPNSPYAASKAAADRLCYSYFRSFGTNVTIIRPFNVFGERQKSGQYGALIPILTSRAMNGLDLVVFGDGKQTRDFSYISDMTNMYNLAVKKGLIGKTINFASGKNIRIIDIAKHIAKKFGVKVGYGPARQGEVSEFNADISLAQSFGWKPKIDFWQGLDRYTEWAKKHPKYFESNDR
jgi:dTDP-glucose 4,6-dehydratase